MKPCFIQDFGLNDLHIEFHQQGLMREDQKTEEDKQRAVELTLKCTETLGLMKKKKKKLGNCIQGRRNVFKGLQLRVVYSCFLLSLYWDYK